MPYLRFVSNLNEIKIQFRHITDATKTQITDTTYCFRAFTGDLSQTHPKPRSSSRKVYHSSDQRFGSFYKKE